MSYTDSKACEMLSSRCAACGRKLVDASSVEAKMGPHCRDKYNYEDAPKTTSRMTSKVEEELADMSDKEVSKRAVSALKSNEDTRKGANILIHFIANNQEGKDVVAATEALRHMNYDKLADRIKDRLNPAVEVSIEDGRLILDTGYHQKFITQIKKVSGRRYNPDDKTWDVPVRKKREAWSVMKECFEGELGHGPEGMFFI